MLNPKPLISKESAGLFGVAHNRIVQPADPGIDGEVCKRHWKESEFNRPNTKSKGPARIV